MLVDDMRALAVDPILAIISDGRGSKRLAEGVYQIGHFGMTGWPSTKYKDWVDDLQDDFGIYEYGVADSWQQVLEKGHKLIGSERKFLITVTPILKSEQEPTGGWRWHKWGPYIGDHEPTTEYLYDEPLIDEVVVYHVYERKS